MLLIRVLAVLVCFSLSWVHLSPTLSYKEREFKKSILKSPLLFQERGLGVRCKNIKSKENLHDFHTSLTELQYNPKEKSYEVSIRMFTDDLENTLTKFNGGKKVFIGGKNDNADEVIKRYIPQHFAVYTAQKQKKAMNILGKEIEGDATWVYVEIPDAQGVLGGILQNDLLVEMFDDQTNLVNFIYQNQKKTFLFNSKVKSTEIHL